MGTNEPAVEMEVSPSQQLANNNSINDDNDKEATKDTLRQPLLNGGQDKISTVSSEIINP